MAGHVLAAGLNAAALRTGQPPSGAGVAASAGYLAGWLGFALWAGRCADCVPLRRLAGFWAAAVAAAAIGGSLLRQAGLAGPEGAGGWLAVVLLVAAPLYGVAGLFAVDPVIGLVPTALGAAIVVMAVAALIRRRRRSAAGRPGHAGAGATR